ncbi:DEAD-box family RNA helicase [Theileria orientalis]|uniref:RNA helicase n=1 Tax=Theileria orientalis TaxID=68886 RepID=A0A976QSE3_THEOR|nr:DEAD-box family RNA helicase [Theileria orientalis]
MITNSNNDDKSADEETKQVKKIYLPPGRRNPPADSSSNYRPFKSYSKNNAFVQRRQFFSSQDDQSASYIRNDRISNFRDKSNRPFDSLNFSDNSIDQVVSTSQTSSRASDTMVNRTIPLETNERSSFGGHEKSVHMSTDRNTSFGTSSSVGSNRFSRAFAPPKPPTSWAVRGDRRYYEEKEADVFEPLKSRMSTGINFNSYDNIPVQMTGHLSSSIKPIEEFDNAVHPMLLANIRKVNYSKPTPIQRHSISVILEKRDLMACAQTGSGKTAAFLLPIVTCMLKTGPPRTPALNTMYSNKVALPVCLVLSPTRELAVQIYTEARKFNFGTGIRTVVLYGGSEVRRQLIELERGCDICVATPGRLTDLVERRKVIFTCIKYLVLDEADRMLDMGFAPQIRAIVTHPSMPGGSKYGDNFQPGYASAQLGAGRYDSTSGRHHLQSGDKDEVVEERQTVMFSATFPKEIQQLAKEFLKDYIYLAVGRVGSTNEFIKQRMVYADQDQKVKYLIKLLKENTNLGGLVLIFVETKKRADLIEGYLLKENFKAVNIHGDRSQEDREKALSLFKAGVRPIMVATDVAARGLDISNITHVINCDLPTNIDDYVHRIGRTGRAGNVGIATSLVNESNRPILKDLLLLLQESNQEVPVWFKKLVTTVSGPTNLKRVSSKNKFNTSGINKDIRTENEVSMYNYSKGKTFQEFEDDWW